MQDVLNGKNTEKAQKHNFLYRGYLYCAICGCKYTASLKKSRYAYYYCTNGKGVCAQHRNYLPEKRVQNILQGQLDTFLVDEEMATLSLEAYADGLMKQTDYESSSRERVNQLLDDIIENQNNLLDLLLAKKITQERYDENDKKLEKEKFDLQVRLKNMKPRDVHTTLELLQKVKEEVYSAQVVFKEGDDEVREDILKSALWNLKLKNRKIQSVQYKLPYAYLLNLHKNRNLED